MLGRWFRRDERHVEDLGAGVVVADSLTNANRFRADEVSVGEAPPKPDRFRADSQTDSPRPFEPRRAPGTTATGEVYIDRHSMLDRLLNGPSAYEHAEHVLRCFHHSCFQPGDVIETHDMQEIYLYICRQVGWRPLKWGGPEGVGNHLRQLFNGPGKPKHHKPYRELPGEDGVRKRARVFIVPPRVVSERMTRSDAAPRERIAA
jgi:hypothetical protein